MASRRQTSAYALWLAGIAMMRVGYKAMLAGASSDGAGVTRKLHLSPDHILESVKRGAEEMGEVAMEACEAR
jgi:hypothetical protein